MRVWVFLAVMMIPAVSWALPLWIADGDSVAIDHAVLDNIANKSVGEFSLPVDGFDFQVRVQTISEPNLGVTSIGGIIDGNPASVFLLCRADDGATVAFFQPGNGLAYRLDHTRGRDVVSAVSAESYTPCAGGLSPVQFGALSFGGEAPEDSQREAEQKVGEVSDDGSRHDVLIAYTPGARDSAGGESFILAEAQMAVDSANLAYLNSNINSQLRLVHVMETNYLESSAFTYTGHINALFDPDDGDMDDVLPRRDLVGADFVSVLVDGESLLNPGGCGIAPVMGAEFANPSFEASALSVVSRHCATDVWSFAHEIGHNRGCTHNREDSTIVGAYSYSYGHRWTDYRTIMSYNNASKDFDRIRLFSNPDVDYLGTPVGVAPGSAGEAHNVLTHNNTAGLCADFREERTFVQFGWGGSADGFWGTPYPSLSQGVVGSRTGGTLVLQNSDAAFVGTLTTPRTYVHDGAGSATMGGS